LPLTIAVDSRLSINTLLNTGALAGKAGFVNIRYYAFHYEDLKGFEVSFGKHLVPIRPGSRDEETVQVFNFSGEDPPYYASKGMSNDDEPLMTCYITFQHHTDFPRRHVIPFADGVKAVHQFLDTNDLPTCVEWGRVVGVKCSISADNRVSECNRDITSSEKLPKVTWLGPTMGSSIIAMVMNDETQSERLSAVARHAWKRLESEFPQWKEHLDTHDGELEFAIPAPTGSAAGHLVALSHQNNLWVRFSPPHMCYLADDEDELVSLIRQLTTDKILFKVTTKGDEWVETTLARPEEKPESLPGHSVRYVSWSGRCDDSSCTKIPR